MNETISESPEERAKRGPKILLPLMLLLASAGLVFAANWKQVAAYFSTGEGPDHVAGHWLFEELASTGDITRINIQRGGESLVLAHDPQGFWVMPLQGGARADDAKVNEFLSVIATARVPEGPLLSKASLLQEYELDNGSKSASFVEIMAAEKSVAYAAAGDRFRLDQDVTIFRKAGLHLSAAAESWLTPSLSLIGGQSTDSVRSITFKNNAYRLDKGPIRDGTMKWVLRSARDHSDVRSARVAWILKYLESLPIVGLAPTEIEQSAMLEHVVYFKSGRQHRFWLGPESGGGTQRRASLRLEAGGAAYWFNASLLESLSPSPSDLALTARAAPHESDSDEGESGAIEATLRAQLEGIDVIVISHMRAEFRPGPAMTTSATEANAQFANLMSQLDTTSSREVFSGLAQQFSHFRAGGTAQLRLDRIELDLEQLRLLVEAIQAKQPIEKPVHLEKMSQLGLGYFIVSEIP